MNKDIKGRSKNQTAVERMKEKEIVGVMPSRHLCASPKCPAPRDRILIKDLQPVQAYRPKKVMEFYHRACYAAL